MQCPMRLNICTGDAIFPLLVTYRIRPFPAEEKVPEGVIS